jgi:hypothetical protein
MPGQYQYKVAIVRDTIIGNKVSEDKLEKTLNEYAVQGWRCINITPTEVKGRVGPGGVGGLMVTFEKQIA